MSKLFITDSGPAENRVAPVKAVREARKALGLGDSLVASKRIVDTLRETGDPQLLGETDNDDALDAAKAALNQGDCQYASPNGSTEASEPPPGSPEATFKRDARYTTEACRVAVVALTASQGNPNGARALLRAFSFAQGGDVPILEEAYQFILEAYDTVENADDQVVIMS